MSGYSGFGITQEEMKVNEIKEAKRTLIYLNTIKQLVNTDEDLAVEIHVCDLVVGLSDTKTILPAIETEIQEIEGYLRGEENNYDN